MNKESNIFKNIITVLLAALLIFGMMTAGNAGTSTKTVGNVNATLTDNTSLVSTSVNINFTVNDTVNATSYYNITFPTGFNAGGATVNVTINGSTSQLNWTNATGTLFVNVSSNDPTNFSADNGTIQYINLSNITTPSTAARFTINITTNNSGVVIPLNYTTSVAGSVRAPVDLGTAGNFVILSKTKISTTGTTSITGDIGVSPVAASYITGFGLIMDSSNTFSTSSLVTGNVYAADYTAPTPATMTTAISDMETAYTAAAGVVSPAPDATELGAGDISGMTLYPGLYKWGTGLLITNGVTLDCQGNASAVYIFQIAQTLTVANGAIVTLSGGCQAQNIFWQVGGQTTLGTTSDFKGIILDQTAIVLNNGAKLDGRALAQTEVTLIANTITMTADTTKPTVSSTVPLNATTGVAINSAMTATFSEAMNESTVTNVTFTLMNGTTPVVSGTVTYSGVTATFTPDINLTASTDYTATITTGAKDLAGNALASNYTWNFTTGATPDTTAPTVSSTVPLNATTGVAINSAMSATFSEAMNPLTVTTLTFTLKQGTTPVSGLVTYSGVTATFTPTSNLAASTTYTATITTGVKDLAGNALASNYTWSFTTSGGGGGVPLVDTTPPIVSYIIPVNAATDVAINSAMVAIFSEGLDPLTVTTATFTLKQGVTLVSGAVTYTGVTATFIPASNLSANSTYTATITTGVKDYAGNALAVNKVWTFTTGAAPDTTPPMVTATIHANGSTGVPINTKIAATFSEAMDPLTVTTASFTLKQGATPVSGTVTYSGVTATFTPDSNLTASTTYTATITTGVKDLAGNALAVNKVWSFTTGAATDTTAPTVSSTVPLNAATGVAINSAMTATFSEAMNPLTVTTASFTLKQGATPVLGTVTYSGVTATFTPDSNLAASTTYTATITTGVKDLAGNALASNYTWSFTTSGGGGGVPLVDTTPPIVSYIIPVNAATGVAINSAMVAIFSEGLDPLTVTTASFTLKQGATPVSGAVTYSGVTATFTPDSNLTASTTYTATITTGVKDLAGNALASNYTWNFTTGATLVITASKTNITTGLATPVTFTVTDGTSPVSGATVTLTGSATGTGTTDAAGTVAINVTATSNATATATATMTGNTAGTKVIVAKGDVNGDGSVTIVDALFIAQYTVGSRPIDTVVADVNGDGQATIVDALFIAQYTVHTKTDPTT